MKNVQLKMMGRITCEQDLFISWAWLIGFLAFYFAGQGIAGFITDYLEYWMGALILFGMSCVSCMISVVLYIDRDSSRR